MMNEYLYIGGVVAVIALMSVLLHISNKRQDKKLKEEIEIIEEVVVEDIPIQDTVEEIFLEEIAEIVEAVEEELPQVIEIIVETPTDDAPPKQNKVKLPEPKVQEPLSLIEVVTHAVEKDK